VFIKIAGKEDRGDLGDGLLAGVVELLGQLHLLCGEFRFAPAGAAPSTAIRNRRRILSLSPGQPWRS
jgi:hypothetical protein